MEKKGIDYNNIKIDDNYGTKEFYSNKKNSLKSPRPLNKDQLLLIQNDHYNPIRKRSR